MYQIYHVTIENDASMVKTFLLAVYIDAGDSATDTASLDFTGAFTSSTDFSIKVTQIECDSDDM